MSSERKNILAATLGDYIRLDAAVLAKLGGEENIKKAVAASVQQAAEAGFDVENIALNPNDVDDTLNRLEQKLKSQHWDGVLIGFMIRGNKDYTVVFEAAVNACRRVAPETVMLFGTSWDDLLVTLHRNFPEAK